MACIRRRALASEPAWTDGVAHRCSAFGCAFHCPGATALQRLLSVAAELRTHSHWRIAVVQAPAASGAPMPGFKVLLTKPGTFQDCNHQTPTTS